MFPSHGPSFHQTLVAQNSDVSPVWTKYTADHRGLFGEVVLHRIVELLLADEAVFRQRGIAADVQFRPALVGLRLRHGGHGLCHLGLGLLDLGLRLGGICRCVSLSLEHAPESIMRDEEQNRAASLDPARRASDARCRVLRTLSCRVKPAPRGNPASEGCS
jgi:hypothetical protein